MHVIKLILFYFVVLLIQTPKAHAAAWETLKVRAPEANADYGNVINYIWEAWWANAKAFGFDIM